MIKGYELLIAWRYLRTKQKDGFISIIVLFALIGVIIGVATLIIVMSVMNGYEVELTKRLVGINGHITLNNRQYDDVHLQHYVDRIRKIEGVDFAAALTQGQGMLVAGGKSAGVMIRGMRSQDLHAKPLFGGALVEGSFYADHHNQVIIGSALARSLGVHPGDSIKLLAASDEVSILGMVPKIKTFIVQGVFDLGMYEYNIGVIFMPLDQAQTYFDGDVGLDVEIILSYPLQTQTVKSKIAAISPPDMALLDHTSSTDHWIAALRVERTVMFVILSMIIVVAVFNIISSLIMLVKDKAKSIAILRTMGISRVSIMKIFILCGAYIGVTGTIIGAMVGVLFSLHVESIRSWLESMSGLTLFDPVIYYLTKLPSALDINDVTIIVLVAVALSLLATIYPSWRAAKLLPAKVLRYE